ncbi:MAG: nucleotidyltransferase domain-containing protein [Thermoleophilia bacterium]|nr:nucleotidyltransferase domain-containing protein [Thermoleophilia bacterium]
MNVSRPYSVISSPLDVEALLVLRRTTRPLTGRDVARLASRGSTAGIRKALVRLTAHGIIQAEEAGRAILYTLNREHLAVPALEALASMQTELKRRLSTEIGGWSLQPNHVSIFGSAARGDGDTSSDIDLFVVRSTGVDEEDPVWREQLARLASNTFSWTGNHLAVSEVDTDELRRLGQESPSVVEDLREDSITLAGGDVNLELNGTQ